MSCSQSHLKLNRRKVNGVLERNLKPYPFWKKVSKGDIFKAHFLQKFLKTEWTKRQATRMLSYGVQMPSKREDAGILERQRSEVWGCLTCLLWMYHLGYSLPEYKLSGSSPPILGWSPPGPALSLCICLLGRGGIWSVAKPQDRMPPLPPLTHKTTGPAHFPFWHSCSRVHSGALAILTAFLHSTETNACICECALWQGWEGDQFLSSPGKAQSLFLPLQWHQLQWKETNSSFPNAGFFVAE